VGFASTIILLGPTAHQLGLVGMAGMAVQLVEWSFSVPGQVVERKFDDYKVLQLRLGG
jgi:hypothetical protein